MTPPIQQITLIGAGQLGSRLLQGLAQIDADVELAVIDPSPAGLEIAQARYREIRANPRIRKIRFLTNLDSGGRIDLCVVATKSDVRADVVRRLLAAHEVKNMLLEKFLFQTVEDFEDIGRRIRDRGVAAYVNCTRRAYPFYRKLRDRLKDRGPVSLKVQGSSWGLGCNAIHFVDLLAFLTGDGNVTVEAASLDPKVIASKRTGFVEFTGTLRGSTARGHRFRLISEKEGKAPVSVEIEAPGLSVRVDEAGGTAIISAAGAPVETISVDFPLLSAFAGILARQILVEGDSDLPSFEESARLHLPLLEAFTRHLRAVGYEKPVPCPIT